MVAKGQVNEVISQLLDSAIDPRVSVVGVGGAGGNIVSSLYDREMRGLEYVAVNADEEGLARTRADVKVLLDLSAHDGHRHERVESAVEAAREALHRTMSSDIVFLICGLGGATGTRAAPIVAEVASENGAVVITIAIMPFVVEGRAEVAAEGLAKLKEKSHAVLVVDNNNLLSFETLGFNDAMLVVNELVATLVKSVVDQLATPLLNSLAEEVQLATQAAASQESNQVGVDVDVGAPSGVEATPEFRPVGFDDKGFIGFA